MQDSILQIRRIPLGLTYFAAASFSLGMTRYDGGIAFLWIATPLLIADLMLRPRRQWAASILPCAIASGLATGLFGLGWAIALPFVAINIMEALLAAWMFRRFGHPLRPLGSLSWLLHFVLSVGLAALACAALAAVALWLFGWPSESAFVNYSTGRALGSITVIPLAMMVASTSFKQLFRGIRRGEFAVSIALMLLVFATSLGVFAQSELPLLFLPLLPIIFVTFCLGRGGAALAIVILAVVAGAANAAGLGPLQLIGLGDGPRVQFLQFYLAATVLTVLPVAAHLQQRERLERALRSSEERYRLIADHSSDILMKLNLDATIKYVSPSIREIGGYEPEMLIGRNSAELVAEVDREHVREWHRRTMSEPERTHCFEYRAITAGGEQCWFETHSRAVINAAGAVAGTMSIIRDISARKATEQRLTEEALTDVLTGLPNRRALRETVDARVAEGVSDRDCIALLDIDHFKRINDLHGHPVGDIVLRNFAAAATQAVREDDVVVRFGGEEFVVLFLDTPLAHALEICERLRSRVASAVTMSDGAAVRITVSGGVAPIGTAGLTEALKVADAALYRAKSQGRDRLALAA